MVSAAHVFGTVSITTERKLPPKTLNLNRRHMAYEGPPRKKLKSINPLYPQTPLQWSVHNAQRASLGGRVKSSLLYTLHISSSSQMAFQSIWRTSQMYVLIISSWRGRRTHAPCNISVYSCKALWDICSKLMYVLSVRWAPPSGSWGWAAGHVCLPQLEGSGWSWAQRRWETTYPWSPSHPTLRGKQSRSL